ncbi:MAG: hypothetical protein M3Q55_15705, partial [Acidobacteriota bacterium]|nr:hypothetical protein [Acidobacteriota bacterium]
EIGRRVTAAGEQRAAAWITTGARAAEHWGAPTEAATFYDALGIAEMLGTALGVEFQAEPATAAWLVPGRAARLIVNGTPAGRVGQLLPAIADARGVPGAEPIFCGEIDLDAIAPMMQGDAGFRARALPRFPSIVRDISIVVDEALPARELRGTIRAEAPPTLVRVREFDRYKGKGVPDGRVSLSIRMTFRDADRTLTDEEVQAAVDTAVAALAARHGAALR